MENSHLYRVLITCNVLIQRCLYGLDRTIDEHTLHVQIVGCPHPTIPLIWREILAHLYSVLYLEPRLRLAFSTEIKELRIVEAVLYIPFHLLKGSLWNKTLEGKQMQCHWRCDTWLTSEIVTFDFFSPRFA